MSRLDDLAINCAARRVLVRHWIDLGKVSLRTTNSILHLHGALDRVRHVENQLAPSDVREIAAELRRIPHVRRVQMDFANWMERDGVWSRVLEKQAAHPLLSKQVPENAVFEINESELPASIAELGLRPN